jgi:hypothetical protein
MEFLSPMPAAAIHTFSMKENVMNIALDIAQLALRRGYAVGINPYQVHIHRPQRGVYMVMTDDDDQVVAVVERSSTILTGADQIRAYLLREAS